MAGFAPHVTVAALLGPRVAGETLHAEIVAGRRGTDRHITLATIQKTGLALAGFDSYLQPGRVLVFGNSEVSYLATIDPEQRRESLRRVMAHDIPCVLLTNALPAPPEMIEEADRAGVPVLCSTLPAPTAIARITFLLEDWLAPREIVHGVLLDVLGLGVLLIGESGIGKSECALDLIVRGQRLVADDAVEIRRRAESVVIGTAPEVTRHHMELRGIGIVNVRDLFGVASTRRSKRVELVVQLERWDVGAEYDRLGLDTQTHPLLGVAVPLVRMPVAPGRNVAMLVEVAARHQLLRARGRHAARELVDRFDRRLRENEPEDPLDIEDDR